MKTISRFLVLVFAALFVASCTDLNTFPEGGTKTEEQIQAAVKNNPELMKADVAAIYSKMIELYAGGTGYHFDFGYSSLCITMDAHGQDVTCANIGYNWFSEAYSYSGRRYTSSESAMTWNLYYKIIAAANRVLLSATADVQDETLKAYRGQALACRAFAYLNMAQLYQFNYKGNESKLCVPIVTETLAGDALMNNPRATVQAVYDLVMADLNEAITLLDGYKRDDKGQIDQAVAYGLRARANLTMQNWAEAAADAEQALTLSKTKPYTMAEVSKPTFTSANANSVLWANIITENNDVVLTSIVNWPSHLSSLFSDGYTGVGVAKCISVLLYNEIESSDVRKGWWLNENLKSPLVDSLIYDDWRKDFASKVGKYANVKFGVYNDNMKNFVPAADWILMRYEEMLFIKAEGLAMSGNTAEAKTIIDDFVRTNRNPSYIGAPADPQGLQDEIWMQRRIELWGEGFSFFDIMRLGKPIERTKNGISSFPDAWQFNIPAKSQILLYLIPQAEIEANQGINDSDNNPAVNPPVA